MSQDVIEQVLNHTIRPEKIAIPEAATVEIKRLHLDLVAKAKAFENARAAFGEYIHVTRFVGLGIPSNERWEINEDATYFIKLPEGVFV